MNAQEIRYYCEEQRRELIDRLQKRRPAGENFSTEEVMVSELLFEMVFTLNFIGGEIAAHLADANEVAMERNGLIRVPDPTRIRPSIGSLGGELRCTHCAKKKVLSPEDIKQYVLSGWPRCHGMTMLWITQKELDTMAEREVRWMEAR